MLKTFLEIQTDDDGTPLPTHSTSNYRLFIHGQITFPDGKLLNLKCPLFIKKYSKIVDKYLGRVPVIMIDFVDVYAKTYRQLMNDIRSAIRNAFLQHNYMGNVLNRTAYVENTVAARRTLETFNRYRHKKPSIELTLTEVRDSIRFLSQILSEHFKGPVYILMDDYDTPSTKMFLQGNFTKDETKAFLDFLSDFYVTTLQTNPYLDRAILTGLLPPAAEQKRSYFANITEYNFLDGELMEFYGLTQWAVDGIMHYRKMNEYSKNLVHYWYKGYNVNKFKEKIYHTFEVVKFVAGNEIDNRWHDFIPFLNNCLSNTPCRKKYLNLIYGNEIEIKADYQHFTFEQLHLLHRAITFDDLPINDDNYDDMVMTFMYQHGWITLAENFHPKPNSKYLRMKIPNNHTKQIMEWKYANHYCLLIRMEDTPEDYLRMQLEKFSQNNDSISTSLERAFEYFIRLHEREYGVVFQNKLRNKITIEDYDRLHAILGYIIVDIKDTRYKEAYPPSDNLQRPDTLLVFWNQTVIIEFQLDKPSPQHVLEDAKSYANIIQELNFPIKVVKFVGVNVRMDKTVRIWAEMQYL